MVAKTPEHGGRARYRAGCRCSECRAWKTNDQAAYRERKRVAAGGEPVVEAAPAPEVRARPTREKRPTRAVVVAVGAPDFDEQVRAALTVRRPASDDELAQLIESALWDAHGDSATASVVAADAIRAAGWIHRDSVDPLEILEPSAAIERAAREALPEAKDAATRLRHELVFRGARALDDPANARYFASTVEALRKVLADVKDSGGAGGADAFAALVGAIRGTGGSGNPAPVGDST
ncbi:hypothetical protein [Microbacterium sp. NPDC089188]|uniref:hypothetical protein n=1 Tax=Microbacterium sp. NPDC089188 TaxID=3154971 RepID=UPI00343C40C4